MVLKKLNEVGIVIVSATSDNPTANWRMFELLGAKLFQKNPKVSLNIQNCLGVPVFVTLDACHLIKLIRNALGDFKNVITEAGETISWNHIVNLHQLQKEKGLHLGTKLREAHIDYKSNKMKVRLATQVFSNSCSDALTFCEQTLKLPQFVGCGATAHFLKLFNDLFDILNSRNKFGKYYRAPISSKNIHHYQQFFDYIAHYICNLKLDNGKLIIESTRKQAFLGFLILMKSFVYVYKCYVQTGHLDYILTFKFSQDHIETFFSAIRRSLGNNNNPTPKQVHYLCLLVCLN